MNPQEGDVAEDGSGNFLVFRGGDWYPAQQDGRPLERIPRPDYGAGHYQLPNGDIVRQGPRGGQETVENFGGAGGGAGGSGLVSADQRGRYNIGANPLVRAERNLAAEEANGNPLNRDWGAVALNAIDLDPRGDSSFRPFAPLANLVGGQDYQNAQQALSTYEASLMPIQSGASVTASEAARQIRADFPALGDSPETLRRKAANRRDRINAILAGIGRPLAFTDEDIANPADPSTDREVAALASVGGGTSAPGTSAESAVNYRDPNSREALAALIAEGGWIRDGDAPAYYVGPGGIRAEAPQEGDQNAAPGVMVRPQGPRDPVGALAGLPIGAAPGAFVRGALEQFPGADEAIAGLTGLATGQGFSRAYDAQQALAAYDRENNGVERNLGGIAGAVALAATPFGAPLRVFKGGAAVVGATRGADRVRRLANAGNASAGGAAAGGAWGLGQGEGNAVERLEGAGAGALTGALAGPVAAPVGNALSSGIRSLARPVVNAFGDSAPAAAREFVRPTALSPRGRDVETLLENGVNLTPGQRMGGMAQSVENLAQRAPILGPTIRGARQRGAESLNRSVGLRAMENIGEGIPADVPAGGEMVGYVGRRLGSEFDRAANMVERVAPEEAFQSGVGAIRQRGADLPPAMATQFENIISQRLGRFQGPITGQQLRQIETELSGIAAQYESAADPAQRQLGSMIDDVAGELRASLARANPEAGEILNRASAGWADFTRMRRASAASGGRPFSPNQFSSAVRSEDGSVAKGAVARSEARMQDLSRAAQTIMPDSFGNPGTADAVGLGGIGVGMVTEPMTTSAVVAGLGAASLPYLAMGRRVTERLPEGMRRTLAAIPDQELDALMRAAADPARQADTIDMLASVTESRRLARTIARTLRYQTANLTTGPQSVPQP